MAQTYDAVNSAIQGYYMNYAGLYIPEGNYKESKNPGFAISEQGFSYPVSLTNYIRWQLTQSRLKYFLFHELYRRDTWTRAVIDYIVRMSVRDPNMFTDDTDPDNADIDDINSFLCDAWEDGDFDDLTAGVHQDKLEYQQAYIYVQRERGGERRPQALFPLDARITFPITDQHGTIMFHAQVYNGRAVFFDKDEVLYFPRRNNGSDPKGLSPMESLYESIVMELSANKYNAALFENGLNIGAVFSIPNATTEDVEENLAYLEDHFSTPENAHRPLILKGEAKLLRDGMILTKDINWEALIAVARERVCAVFGVPESLLGIPGGANRSEGQVHERQTYITTIRPLRREFCRQFTRQFVRGMWNNKHIKLEEPINSLIPTKEDLESVALVAEIGATYNDIRAMMGLPRVPNGDYFVQKNPANGGMTRLDQIMPGLGDPHFDLEAYQLLHQEEQEVNQKNSLMGVNPPAGAGATAWAPPRPQDQIQVEPIGARIVDVSRSLIGYGFEYDYSEDYGDYVVARRTPLVPGSRGGTPYTTASGKIRYGPPPKGKAPNLNAPDGSDNNNTLVNPKDIASPKRLTPDERQQVRAAHAQISNLFRQAQMENWTNEEFMGQLDHLGWSRPSGAEEAFIDPYAARVKARQLAEADTGKTFTILGADGAYFIMEQDMSNFTPEANADRRNESRHTKGAISKSMGEYLTTLRAFTGGHNAP
jgi:HK97 family phage portal protein